MSQIYKTINIEWKGETVRVTPTFKLINAVEDEINLVLLARRLSDGDIRFSHVATLYSLLLKAGGERVGANEVYQAMFSGREDDEQAISNALNAANQALEAFYPQSESNQAEKKSQDTLTK